MTERPFGNTEIFGRLRHRQKLGQGSLIFDILNATACFMFWDCRNWRQCTHGSRRVSTSINHEAFWPAKVTTVSSGGGIPSSGASVSSETPC